MDLPAGLDLVEQSIELFDKFVNPAFRAERIIIVANQFGGQKLSVYAMGGLKEGKTVADLGGRAKVQTGMVAAATQPALPVATTLPSTTQPTPSPAQDAREFATRP
jgi:hypothetical protein